MTILGGDLTATETIVNGQGTFAGTVTDTLLFDGACVYMEYDNRYESSVTTCGPTPVAFTTPPNTSATRLLLCLNNICNPLETPDHYSTKLNVAGNGWSWAYYDTPGRFDWHAAITLPSVTEDIFGADNYNTPGNVLVEAYLSVFSSAFCGNAMVTNYNDGPVLATASLCGGYQYQELYTVNDDGGVAGQACSWRSHIKPIAQVSIFGEVPPTDPYALDPY